MAWENPGMGQVVVEEIGKTVRRRSRVSKPVPSAYCAPGPVLNTLQLLTQQTCEGSVSTSAIL